MCIMRYPFVVGMDIGRGLHDTSDAITRVTRNSSVTSSVVGVHQPAHRRVVGTHGKPWIVLADDGESQLAVPRIPHVMPSASCSVMQSIL